MSVMLFDALNGWEPILTQYGIVVCSFIEYRSSERITIPSRYDGLDFVTLACNRDRYPRAFCPSREAFATLANHTRFLAFMERFPGWTPKVLARAPCILRNDFSESGSGVQLFSDGVIQEAIPGSTEMIWHGLIWKGRVVERLAMETTSEYDLEIRRGARRSKIVSEHVAFDPIFEALEYTGFACVNYKMVGNTPKIFEINPRMGGSLVFSSELGRMLDVVKTLVG